MNLKQNWPLLALATLLWFGTWQNAITAAAIVYIITTLWIRD